MAEGIKYFPKPCHNTDDRIRFIKSEFGLKGYAIVDLLYCKIHGEQGYFCVWNDKVCSMFASEVCCNAGKELVNEVVKAAIRENIFDRTMYEKYGILTSLDIQKTFYNVAKRREEVFDVPEYVLFIPYTQNSNKSGVVSNSTENVCNKGQNVCNETTSRVEESRVDKSRGEESKPPAAALSPDKKKMLIAEYGAANVAAYEQRFLRWKSDKPNFKADMFETIARWLDEDKPAKMDEGNSSFSAEAVEQAVSDRYRKLGGDANV